MIENEEFCTLIYFTKWAATGKYLSLGFPKKWASNQPFQVQVLVRKIEISLIATLDMFVSHKRKTKMLISLCGCTGWSAPLLFANPWRQIFLHVETQISLTEVLCRIFTHWLIKVNWFTYLKCFSTLSKSRYSCWWPDGNIDKWIIVKDNISMQFGIHTKRYKPSYLYRWWLMERVTSYLWYVGCFIIILFQLSENRFCLA